MLVDFERINMAINANAGHHQGYCFVQFPSRESAEKAIAPLEDISIYGRPLKVGPSRAPKPQQHASTSRSSESFGSSSPSWRSGRRELGRSEEQEHTRESQHQEHQGNGDENSRKLYVGGLCQVDSPEQHEEEVRQIFADFDVYVSIFRARVELF